jgi:prevent-host-death family protein
MPTTDSKMELSDAPQPLQDVMESVARGETRVVVESSGRPVAAIVSADEYRRFAQYEAERAERDAAVSELSRAFADVPLDELEYQIKRSLDEVRAEARAQRAARSA